MAASDPASELAETHAKLQPMLQALAKANWIDDETAAELTEAYWFLRDVEHRIQMEKMRRTHLMPTDELSLRRLARAVGIADAGELRARWRDATRRVLGLQQRWPVLPGWRVWRLPGVGQRPERQGLRGWPVLC